MSKPAPAPRRRAAPTPLSRERILDAAFALVSEQGLAALSTRKLGTRLRCQAMSIYHHFPSKHHLLDAMVEHALAGVEVPEPGPDPEARLRSMLESYRAMARRWPALYPLVAVHRLNMPAGVRMIEAVLRLIHSANGGDVELTARQFRAIGYYLTGAALDEAAGYAKGPSAAEPVSDAFIAEHCPLLASVAPYFKPAHWDATWRYGLDALLDRAREDAAAATARAGRRARAAS
ncbi:MAG TPA: TetR/AcrR family transcriptional regulator [Ideonella sp.]|nr:TetR/AcrR family transcriptional regulator [Ideonella sp.]